MPLATNALTDYPTAKAELGLGDDTQRTVVERLINAASQAIEQYCNRAFAKVSRSEKLAYSGTLRLVLAAPPIASIASITDDGGTVDQATYRVEDATAGIVVADSVWARRNLVLGVAQDQVAGTGEARLVVTYTGGYVLPWDTGNTRDLPYDLEQACLDTVVALYRRRGQDLRIASESMGDASATYRTADEGGIIPAEVLPTLNAYRRVVFG